MTPDAARAAERLLAEAGLAGRVSAAGHDGTVARITAPSTAWPDLTGARGAELARQIRELGFKYVAIDLDGANDHDIHAET